MKFEAATMFGKAPKLTKAQLRRTMAMFMEDGLSTHSAMGLTLAPLLNELEERKIPYTLKAYPGVGYVVEKAPLLFQPPSVHLQTAAR